jgi:hypothetical protein
MIITVKKTTVVEEEVDVQLPLYWKLDNWFHKIESLDEGSPYKAQLTSVTLNSMSITLMTLVHFQSYYEHYRGLYEKITEQEFVTEFDRLNNYLK